MRSTRIRLGATVLVLALAGGGDLSASAGERGAQRASSTERPRVVARAKIKIVNFAFQPKTISISKGTRVKWTNRGSVSHTSTSNTGKWDSGAIAPGDTFSRTFRTVGTFRYHCSIHPTTMKAKIVVG